TLPMMPRALKWLVPVMMIGSVVAVPFGSVSAQRGGPARKVQDSAKMFSDRARQKADALIDEIKRQFKKDLIVVTFSKASESIKDVNVRDPKEKRRFFVKWAQDEARARNLNGVLILFCKDPGYVIAVAGKETRKKAFTDANLIEL